MNNKGITMVTVVVMIIVMLIIATVSIVAGNKLIIESKEYEKEQEYHSVKEAVLRKKSEVNMAGSLIPIGESYVGIKDPILKSDDSTTITATGWYLLDNTNLEKLGIFDASSRYVVNYDYEEVVATDDEEYIEKYMLIECIHEIINAGTVRGTQLKNKTTDSSAKMVRNTETGDVYGDGWYIVSVADLPSKYKTYIDSDYLVNYETAQYVKMDSNFEQI